MISLDEQPHKIKRWEKKVEEYKKQLEAFKKKMNPVTDASTWPKTVEEAAEIVYKPLSDEFKHDFISKEQQKSIAEFHSTMGRRIRNMFGLWNGNEALLFDAGTQIPDSASWGIMEVIYDKCVEYDKYRRRHGGPICKTDGCSYPPPVRGVCTCRYCGKQTNVYSKRTDTTIKPEGTFSFLNFSRRG
jgi:hypothetical protein